jgi:hypothetical protein
MTVWVVVGIALMVIGVYTTLWVSFLGAAVIGSTPVFFTLRSALATRQVPKRSTDPLPDALRRAPERAPAARRPVPRRRRGHDW